MSKAYTSECSEWYEEREQEALVLMTQKGLSPDKSSQAAGKIVAKRHKKALGQLWYQLINWKRIVYTVLVLTVICAGSLVYWTLKTNKEIRTVKQRLNEQTATINHNFMVMSSNLTSIAKQKKSQEQE